MEISDQLALEIYTIILFHVLAISFVLGFTFYVHHKAKKDILYHSYLSVVAMLLIWMFAKIFKTVSPNEEIRWIFIVIQYIGVDFLGYCLILFALVYTRGHLPRRIYLILLALPPLSGFLIVLTNPLHMKFYRYYDFYRDSFGPYFFPFQIIQYLYLLIGVFLLAKGFTTQEAFQLRKRIGRFFALLILLPIAGNIYYLLIKLTDVPWVLNFPFFDFTPITSSIALMLFIIPAIRYRFLDIHHIAYRHLYEQLPTGVACCDSRGKLYAHNTAMKRILPYLNESHESCLPHKESSFVLPLKNGTSYKVNRYPLKGKKKLLFFTDLSQQITLTKELQDKNEALHMANQRLQSLRDTRTELAKARIQTKIAQDIHDILGHSLTVVIGSTDLAANSKSVEEAQEKLSGIKELLMNGLTDLQNSLEGKNLDLGNTSLIRALHSLENKAIELDLLIQGKPYELNSKQTETIYRLCQEAMTNSIRHGEAHTLHIIARYQSESVELFLIDDGCGCKVINKNLGLLGMEKRVHSLGGTIEF
ncbi:MAG: hypothetical protein JW708_09170, partial [Vallitaleaceae bacterium]|nr:hypothetical protein [Vallitaleaceae bacterium]